MAAEGAAQIGASFFSMFANSFTPQQPKPVVKPAIDPLLIIAVAICVAAIVIVAVKA